jgi:hypothetical protein
MLMKLATNDAQLARNAISLQTIYERLALPV